MGSMGSMAEALDSAGTTTLAWNTEQVKGIVVKTILV